MDGEVEQKSHLENGIGGEFYNTLETKITKLKLSYIGHIMRKQSSLEKTIMLGKVEGSKKRGRPDMRWIDFIQEATG